MTHSWLEAASAAPQCRLCSGCCSGARDSRTGRSGLRSMLGKDPGPEQRPPRGGWGRAQGGCCTFCQSFSGGHPGSLCREQEAQLAELPMAPDEGKGAAGGGLGERGGFAPFLWQHPPAAPHPLRPQDPDLPPGCTRDLPLLPCPGPAQLQPLNPAGVFQGAPASWHPGACSSAGGVFRGVP